MSDTSQRSYSDETAIRLVGLGKSFSNFRALDNLNLEISKGEVFGLLGPNGAGKTTTMRLISCLLRPSEGEIYVNGRSASLEKNRAKISRDIGLLTESPNLYERLTAQQNLAFFARAYGVKESEIDSRIEKVLRSFDLTSRRQEKVVKFSKGMKQKLAIARVLVHDPSILLLDEPTSSLDAESAKSIRDLISETASESGNTVLLSTHNLDDASKLCNRIAILSKGKMLAMGAEGAILAQLRATGRASEEPTKLRIGLIDANSVPMDEILHLVPGIVHVTKYSNAAKDREGLEITFEQPFHEDVDSLTAKTIECVVRLGGKVTDASQIKPTLEEIYLKLVRLGSEEALKK